MSGNLKRHEKRMFGGISKKKSGNCSFDFAAIQIFGNRMKLVNSFYDAKYIYTFGTR
jgi:hypothetical protein